MRVLCGDRGDEGTTKALRTRRRKRVVNVRIAFPTSIGSFDFVFFVSL